MIYCFHVDLHQEERLLHRSPDPRRDAFHGGTNGQTWNQRRRRCLFYETEPLHGFRMDAPVSSIGLGDLAIHQSSGSQAETQIRPLFQAHTHVASSCLSLRILVGPVDGAPCQKFDQKIVRHYASSQAHAKIPAQTGTGAESSRASRPGARPQGGASMEKENPATNSSLLHSSQRDSSLRRRESFCLDSPYWQDLDVPKLEAHRPRLGPERRSCGGYFRGESKGTFVFSVLQGQFQLQDIYSIHENASGSFHSPKDLFRRRRSSFSPIQDGERICPTKYSLVVAASIARVFSRTQLQRRGLERNENSAAQCQTFERLSRTQEGCSWFSAFASKEPSKGARVL